MQVNHIPSIYWETKKDGYNFCNHLLFKHYTLNIY